MKNLKIEMIEVSQIKDLKHAKEISDMVGENSKGSKICPTKLLELKKQGMDVAYVNTLDFIVILFKNVGSTSLIPTTQAIESLSKMKSVNVKIEESNELDQFDLSVDNILEKINEKGIDSLTKSEKEFLDKQK